MKLLLSPPQEGAQAPAYNFYREGIGFGEIKTIKSPNGSGEYAEVTFADTEDIGEGLRTQYFNDINLEDGWQSTHPEADLSDIQNVERFISIGVNNVISARRKAVAEGYGDRIRKPRIARAMNRRLTEAQFTYGAVL